MRLPPSLNQCLKYDWRVASAASCVIKLKKSQFKNPAIKYINTSSEEAAARPYELVPHGQWHTSVTECAVVNIIRHDPVIPLHFPSMSEGRQTGRTIMDLLGVCRYNRL